MTASDAAGLSLLGFHDRRLVAALIRAAAGRATEEDVNALPPREAGEPLLAWACRARAGRASSGAEGFTRLRAETDRLLERAAHLGVTAIPYGEGSYPPRLAAIPDPPPMLWARGRAESVRLPAVALVGSRAASPYALAMARRLAADLAAAGLVIVSGLARGVDSAAHAAVVAAGERTVGVLGCGIDRIYPAEHRDLARAMEAAGAVVSEFAPGVPPLPHHFPLRNRIISGLALGVVVVEAPEKSGALITASAAAEQGREVMVLPGPAQPARNRGGHLLIRDGARLVESADDILQELQLDPVAADAAAPAWPLDDLPGATDFTVDEVAARTGEPAGVVLARLLELELSGRIQRVGGGRFVRVLT